MNKSYEGIRSEIKALYDRSANDHGETSPSVGWKDQQSHTLRLQVLSEVGISNGCSVLDVGCGYGALLGYLIGKGLTEIRYTGIDLVQSLIEMARKRFGSRGEFKVADIMSIDREYDFVVNLGIFNVKLACDDSDFFEKFVRPIMMKMWKLTRVGMAASFMTDMVDYRNPNLYYASPSRVFDFVRANMSKHVILRHDYGLYEFIAYAYKVERPSRRPCSKSDFTF